MVTIHNIMEEQVIARVNELYEQVKAKNTPWLTCDCENCRLDTINYVLNRIPPHYVVSGRGLTHNISLLQTDNQITVDIDRLGLEGMRLVSTSKRPYHKEDNLVDSRNAQKNHPVFNFPTFAGTVYDGSSFEPLANATILLKSGDAPAQMIDSSWSNPSKTFARTSGNFTFWVAPVPAQKEKENREFTFTVEVSAEGYESVSSSFSLPVISDSGERREFNSVFSLKLQDIFLFRNDIVNEQE